jgi:hypothetical protein
VSDLTLGQILDDTAGRDAIHVAIAPVIAGQSLDRGEPVAIRDGRAYPDHVNPIGVIDPFLPGGVDNGQRCWLFLKPGTITSLRHVWTHPLFDAATPEHGEAEMRLRAFAELLGFTYARLLDAAGEYQASDGDTCVIEWRFESMSIYDGFWKDYEIVTGGKVTATGSFFHCGGCS